VFALDVGTHQQPPLRSYIGFRGRNRRKIIAVRVVVVFADDVGLIQLLSIAVHNPITQVNAVSGYPHYALYHVKARLGWREKDDDVAVARVTIRNYRSNPVGRRRKNFAINKNMVAYEQGVFHGTGRNFKCLHYKRDNEKSSDQHHRDGGEELNRGLFFLGLFRFLLLAQLLFVFYRGAGDGFHLIFYFTSRRVRSQRVASSKCVST